MHTVAAVQSARPKVFGNRCRAGSAGYDSWPEIEEELKPNVEWRPMTPHPAGLSHMPFCCAACAPESGSERIVWIVWDDSRNMFFCQEMGRERERERVVRVRVRV